MHLCISPSTQFYVHEKDIYFIKMAASFWKACSSNADHHAQAHCGPPPSVNIDAEVAAHSKMVARAAVESQAQVYNTPPPEAQT